MNAVFRFTIFIVLVLSIGLTVEFVFADNRDDFHQTFLIAQNTDDQNNLLSGSTPQNEVDIPLLAELVDAQTMNGYIEVSWTYNGEETNISFKVYRDTEKFTDPSQLNSNNFITEVDYSGSDFTIYEDRPVESGEYYYCVTVVDNQGNEYDQIDDNETLWPAAYTVEAPETTSTETYVHNLEATFNRDQRTVFLQWDVTDPDAIEKFYIFRDIEPLETREDIDWAPYSKFVLARDANDELISSFQDVIVEEGSYYYAVIAELKETGELADTMIEGENYLSSTIPCFYKATPEDYYLPYRNLISDFQYNLDFRAPHLVFNDLSNQYNEDSLSVIERETDPLHYGIDIDHLVIKDIVPPFVEGGPEIAIELDEELEQYLLSLQPVDPETLDPRLDQFIQECFYQRQDYIKCKQTLYDYIIRIDQSISETYARYYYARSLYNLGEYRAAWLNFKHIQDSHYYEPFRESTESFLRYCVNKIQ
jgi:hypothetical protein